MYSVQTPRIRGVKNCIIIFLQIPCIHLSNGSVGISSDGISSKVIPYRRNVSRNTDRYDFVPFRHAAISAAVSLLTGVPPSAVIAFAKDMLLSLCSVLNSSMPLLSLKIVCSLSFASDILQVPFLPIKFLCSIIPRIRQYCKRNEPFLAQKSTENPQTMPWVFGAK